MVGFDDIWSGIYLLTFLASIVTFIISIAIVLAIYVIGSMSLSKMAVVTGHGHNKLIAWIPIINYWLMCNIAGIPVWALLLIFIPGVDVLFLIFLNACIVNRFINPQPQSNYTSTEAIKLGNIKAESLFMGFFMTVPIIRTILLAYYAFYYHAPSPVEMPPNSTMLPGRNPGDNSTMQQEEPRQVEL